jgi:hypothetical protein
VNTQAHSRGGEVTVFLPESVCSLETVVELSDPRTGQKVPHREIPQTNPYHREAGRFLVFRIAEVPGLGFERIRVTKTGRVDIRDPYFADVPDYDVPHSAGVVTASPDTSAVLCADGAAAIIENEHLRVSLDIAQGAISEILLKAEARNLVDGESAFGFNAYVYDKYATASKINHMSGHSLVIDDDLALLASRTVNQGAFDVEYGSDEASIHAAATASTIVQPILGVLATPLAAGSGREQRPTTMTIDHDGVRLIDRTWIGDGRMLCRFQSVVTEPVTTGVRCAGAERIVAASMLGSTSDEVPVSEGSFELSVPALGAVAVVVTLA